MDGKEETVAEEATTKTTTTTTTTKEEELKEKRKLRRNLSETSAAEVVKKKPLPPVPGGKSAPQLPPTLASPLLSATSPSSSPTSTQILASLAERSTMDESPASPKSESEEDSDGSVSELSSSSETDESQKPRKNSIMKRVKSLRLTSSFVFAKTPSSYKSAGQEGDAPLSPSSSSSSSSSASPSMQRTSSFSSASPSRRASAAFDSNGTGSPVLGRTRGSMQVGSTGDLSSVSSSYSPSSSSSSLRASSSTFTTSSSSSSFSPSSSPLLSTSPGLGSLDRSEEAARKEPEQPAEPEQEVVLTEEELHKMWGVPDVPQAIVFAEPRTHLYDIRLATNEKLIEKLSIEPASDLEQRHDMYVKIFFMTYRSMITSKFVLDKLWERYEAAGVDPDEAETWNPPLSKIRNTICKVIVFWVNNHYRDFGTDGSALKQLKEFIEKAKLLPQFKGSLLGFLEKMVEKKLGKGTYKSFFEVADTVDNCPPSILPSKDWRSLIFNDLDELEVARQLTIGEHHIYAEIQPIELQDLAWSKDKLKFRAPNVLAMIERFNKYSTIFATLLVGEPRIKDRRRLIERFVRIGEHLLEMNSFNMLMAIMSGFGNSAVYRMKHTFASLPRKTLDTMETFQALLSSNGSYKMYRDRLANVTPPIIPFLGVYLTDLTFANDGNPGELRGLTNFRKLQLEYDIIDQVLRYQKAAAYNFKMVPRMVSFLEGLPKLDEQSLYSMSLQHEPRGVKKKDLK